MSSTKGRRNYFRKKLLVLKMFGVSLTGNEGIAYKIYFLSLALTLFNYPFLYFYEYFKHDVSNIADVVIYQAGAIIALCNVAAVLRNRLKFGKLLTRLEQEPFIPNADRGGQVEEELFGKCLRLTGAQTLFLGTPAVVTIISAILYALARSITSDDYHDWQLPFGRLTLLNVSNSPGYEITWLYQSISMAFMGGQCITIDLLLTAVLAHVVCQFKILQYCLTQMVDTGHKNMMKVKNGPEHIPSNDAIISNETDHSNIPWEYLKKPIVEAVRYHVAIIDITTDMNEIFSDMLLFTFLSTLALICFSTYNASLADSLQSAEKHLGIAFVATLRVALICFWGEQVFQEGQLVAQAAYESQFVGTDLKFQKMLAFIIRRSQNPVKITAGKFADISLATLFWILRTSYSAFMVLRRANV